MTRVRVRDKYEFPLLSVMDLSLSDVVDLERRLGVELEGWSSMAETMAMLWFSAQAHDPDLLSWEDVGALKPGDVVKVPDEEDADPPAAAGDEPAADSEDSSLQPSPSTSP